MKLKTISSGVFSLFCLSFCLSLYSQQKNVLTIEGTRFEMNGQHFEYTGISFFNALYNPAFNKSPEIRREWIRKFNEYGINVLRVWCQWQNQYTDAGPDKTPYNTDGSLKSDVLATITGLAGDAHAEGTVILLTLFSHESLKYQLNDEASDKAVAALAKSLKPYRNIVFQVWNEYNYRTIDYFKIIKSIDPERIVTNSPGFAGVLGSTEENNALDFLSPHTSRADSKHWELAEAEIDYLLKKFNKPVVDDEPARTGTSNFGGPKSTVFPTDQIIHLYNVWKIGGYVIYHHDMFQTGYGSSAVPPSGIPAPGFSSYHDAVFSFLRNKDRYLKLLRK